MKPLQRNVFMNFRSLEVQRYKGFAQQNLGGGFSPPEQVKQRRMRDQRVRRPKETTTTYVVVVSFGDPAEIRTPDTLLKRQMKVMVYQHETAVLTDK